MDIDVNGKRIHPINNETDLISQMRGKRKGSILIVSHDCYYSGRTQMEANSRDIKIIRVG